jgi:multiple sugar transport system permease protein
MIIPFVWMISTSLKEVDQISDFPLKWIPEPIKWKNYTDAWFLKQRAADRPVWYLAPFARFFFNSIFIAVTVTLGQVFTSAMAAFAFARLQWKGRDKVFVSYLATMMVPGQVTMIPVFILIKKLQWVDTYQALILPAMFSAYGTFMLRQFFLSIPRSLEEAATIDGASTWKIFISIILPLSKPALATLTTFTFMGSWNSFLWPLVVTNSMEMRTLPVGVAVFQSQFGTQWALLMAGAMITLMPVLIIYIFNQRFFVKGIALSGMKG